MPFQKGNKFGVRFKKKERFEIKCLKCDKSISLLPWQMKRGTKFCSFSCRSKFNAKHGEAHPRWRGGISSKWDKLHNSPEYQKWRMAVYQRDYFKCQICGQGQSRSNKLHAHHIKPKKTNPELVLDVNNGQTLCAKCHTNVHSGRHRG